MIALANDNMSFAALSQRFAIPVVLAVVVHALALWALIAEWHLDEETMRTLMPTPVIEASLIEMSQKAPEPKPAEPTPRVEPKQEKPKERRSEPREQPREQRRDRDKPKPKPKEKPEVRPEPEINEQDALEQALASEASALDAMAGAELIASYAARIRQLVERAWNRPPSARNGMEAELMIELVPTGEVVNAVVVSGSGDAAFDRSAVSAVLEVRRFEVPTESEVFERNFRRFRLLFKPEDLLR